MAKSKLLRNAGLVIGGVAVLSVVDFLNARVLAPFSPFYKERGSVQVADPELPPLDLSKLKVSDTKRVLAEREAIENKRKETKASNQTLSLGTKSLGEALGPAVKELTKDTTETNDAEVSNEQSSKVMDYLTGKLKDKDMLADTTMTDGEKSLLMSLMSVDRLKKIAKTGNTTAQNQLGLKYHNDEKDAKNALRWFMEAAKGGKDISISNAVAMIESDQISKSTRTKTVNWMRAQADQGRSTAQLAVGQFYRKGLYGFPEDLNIAYALIEKAALSGASEAQFEFGFAKMLGNDVPEDKPGGFNWLLKSAKQGNHRGAYWLADAYKDGDGVEKNEALAIQWFERAHKWGHSSAALQIVFLYRDKNSSLYDVNKTRKWVEVMITQNDSSVGHEYAGDMYLEGRSYPQDDTKAYKHYEIAANKNNGSAQYKLAVMLLGGRGTTQNKQMAIEWLKKADKNYSYEAGVKLNELGIIAE